MAEDEAEDMGDEVPASLKDRVFFAARDGLAITLYALLSENRHHLPVLLNEVCGFILDN